MTRPPVALKRRIAAELRALRERRGLTLEAAAELAEVTKSSLSRFENGHSAPKIHTMRALMNVYNASDAQRVELECLTKEASRRGWNATVFGEGVSVPDWLRTYVGLEATASSLLIHSVFVPSLFQSPEYARTILKASGRDGAELESRMRLLAARQSLLADSATAPEVHAVLDEGALHREVGSAGTTRDQIARLAELADAPHITIQILPFHAGAVTAAVGSGFVVLGLPPDPSLVYLESYEISHYLEGEAREREFRSAFEQLSAAALGADESARMLAAMSTTAPP